MRWTLKCTNYITNLIYNKIIIYMYIESVCVIEAYNLKRTTPSMSYNSSIH